MANTYYYTRTNYFRVTSEEAYRKYFRCLRAEDLEDFTKTEDGVVYHCFGGYSCIEYCDVEAAINQGNKRADLARKMFIYRTIKYIGAYAAAMNGLDILVFTAGIGENDPYIRAQIMKGLSFLGIEVDEEANKVRGEERVISKKGSKVTVCLIPTDEELMIASDTAALV